MPTLDIRFKLGSRLAGPPLTVTCEMFTVDDGRLNLIKKGFGPLRSIALDQIADFEVTDTES